MEMFLRHFVFSVLLSTDISGRGDVVLVKPQQSPPLGSGVGAFLECEICSSRGSSCIGEMEPCDAGEDICATITIENSLENITVLTVVKDCVSSEICMSPGKSMNLGKGRYIRSYSVCCIEDSCAMENPPLVTSGNEVNGKHCPSCFSINGSCHTEEADCSGDENYCFEVFSSEHIGGRVLDTVMKGCATKNVCLAINEGESTPIKESGMSFKHGECTPKVSGGSQTTGLLYLAFAELLLLEIIS
ncbi:phospholipase A2 inhibitor and Ly6/PLAUR domain-containing protein-like [Heteronotia binoei]|uniref:phospholipase A2 inhibitor and Ly6/PLAUR domain-containing protein-like n=1 Tax=Heteronotia binoei TaxID=13085 RepID=UPI002930D111|nr:phospholipase A2 inhibitor and Ly6/PLAUR domain-containing protein-like [Heteronotia binoei]